MYDKMNQFKIQATALETKSMELRQQKDRLQQDKQRLEDVIHVACHGVPEAAIVPIMVPEAKILQLREVITDFISNIEEMELS